jgi:hypothetical protein
VRFIVPSSADNDSGAAKYVDIAVFELAVASESIDKPKSAILTWKLESTRTLAYGIFSSKYMKKDVDTRTPRKWQ